MRTRDDVNKEAKEAFLRTLGKASVLNGTGTGKSKLAIDIIREVDPRQILLLTNSERSRDYSWEVEFKKFGAEDLWERVQPECYQTAYKWNDVYFPFILADEVDFAITEKYINAITSNHCRWLLCLSGFVKEDKLDILQSIAPVCYTYPTQQAQQDGILNKTKFFLVEYELSNERNVMVKKKGGGHFYQSENDAYSYWDRQYQKNIIAAQPFVDGLAQLQFAYDNAEEEWTPEAIGELNVMIKSVEKLQWGIKRTTIKRKEILDNLASSRTVVKALADRIHQNSENKLVIFSELTKQIEQICRYTYHSKNKVNNENIAKLNAGEIWALGVCKAINRGENLVGVNYFITESFNGSETEFQQRHGRGTRLSPEDTMYFIILQPYYKVTDDEGKIKRKPTQAVTWYNKMTRSFDTSNCRVIKMDHLYRLPEGETLT